MSGETFGQMLRRLRQARPGHTNANGFSPARPWLSQNALARMAGLDASYVNHLEAGRIGRTGAGRLVNRNVVLSLAEALDLNTSQTDRLLFAAGLAPQEDYQTRAVKAEAKLAAIREALAEVDDAPTFIRRQVG